LPAVTAFLGALLAMLGSLLDDAEGGRRAAVPLLGIAALLGAIAAVAVPDGATLHSFGASPWGCGAAAAAAAGSSIALARVRPRTRDDITAALVCLSVCAVFLALESRYLVPLLL